MILSFLDLFTRVSPEVEPRPIQPKQLAGDQTKVPGVISQNLLQQHQGQLLPQNQQLHQLNWGPFNQVIRQHQHMLPHNRQMQPFSQGIPIQRDLRDSFNRMIGQQQQQRENKNGVTAHSNGMEVNCLINLFFCVLFLLYLYASNIFSFFMWTWWFLWFAHTLGGWGDRERWV